MQKPSSITIGLSTAFIIGMLSGCTQTNKQARVSTEPEAMEQNTSVAMMDREATPPTTVDGKIQNAMSAAPQMIAADATVMDWPATEGGDFTELHKGTNGWTCFPDTPTTPGNDPICVDAASMQWFKAYMAKEKPDLDQDGIGYMLQGGSDASNTDPFAMQPAPGDDWMNAPPHIMLFPAGDLDPAVYGTEMNGGPWIMWSGTPYEHLMVPVK